MKIEWKGLEISASVTDGIAADTAEGVAFYWDARDIRMADWRQFTRSFSEPGDIMEEDWKQLRFTRRKTDTMPLEVREWIEAAYRDEIDAALLQEWRAMREEAAL